MSKVALLIGVSEYSEPDLNALPNAIADIRALQEVLQHPEMGNFAPEDVIVLENPKREQMEEAIYTLFANRQKEDLVLFYFSGHGITDENGKLYLVTPTTRKDTKGRLVKHTALAANELHNNMAESRSERQVLIFDCCFSGAFARGVTLKADNTIDIQAQLGSKGRAILTSSSATQRSFHLEGYDLSLYTHYLVDGIKSGAADRDGDGWISIDELHDYVSDKVQQAAPTMTPKFFPVEEGHRILLARSPKDDPRLKYRKEVEKRIKQGSLRLNESRFSVPARRMLNTLRGKLNLSSETATQIEIEVLQPLREYQRKLEEYEQTLIETVEQEGFPFSESILNDLKDYRTFLGLRDEDIKTIESRILGELEDREPTASHKFQMIVDPKS
ncbi:MAG: hypothetical protein HC769_00135 [Cyanobacteria bacterium CRU_2_1]|nr:hypothetical protein [Cyanobacteria bacterium RU_5_0]NJR57389.1 hypothetical protein [Cyanobacteria bacterium CRU_2_1]